MKKSICPENFVGRTLEFDQVLLISGLNFSIDFSFG